MSTETTDLDATRDTASRLSWGTGELHVPTDLSMGTIARKALSISSADAIRGCSARWAAEKLFDIEQGPFEPAYIGNAGHDVLERLMQRPPAERTVDTAAQILGDLMEQWATGTDADGQPGEHREFLADPSTKMRWSAAVWNGIQALWDILDPSTIDVYATELQIDTTIGGVPLSGYIDLVYRTTDKKGEPSLGIADYKTGKHPSRDDRKRYGDKHGDQVRLYAEAVEQMLADLPDGDPDKGLKVSEGNVHYTKHGKSEKVAMSAPYRKATMSAHADAWRLHNMYTSTGAYPTKASGLCSYCPLVRLCPDRAEKVKWDVVRERGTALSPVTAPIGRPLDEATPQPLAFGGQWDAIFEAADPYWDALRPWDEWGDALDQTPYRPVLTDLFAPTPALDPFARVEDGIYTAPIDPFAPNARSVVPPLEAPGPAQDTSASTYPSTSQEQSMTATFAPFIAEDQQAPAQQPQQAQQPRFFEDVPYKADPMNVASYAHLSANHIVNLALRQIRLAGVPAHALTQELLRSTADVLWNVITTVQDQLIGTRDLQSAVSRNLLYSLKEVIALEPMPILGDGGSRFATADEVTQWGAITVARLSTMVSLSVGLVHDGGNLGAASQFRGNPTGAVPGQGVQNPASAQYSGSAPIQSAYYDTAEHEATDEWDASYQ